MDGVCGSGIGSDRGGEDGVRGGGDDDSGSVGSERGGEDGDGGSDGGGLDGCGGNRETGAGRRSTVWTFC